MRELEEAAVIDAMIDGVTITDMQGRISDFNRAATQQLGYEKEEAIGETPGELFIVEKEHPRFFEAIEKLLSGKPIEASDYLVKRKDGTEFPVSVSLSVLRGTEGRPNAIVAVHRDITERKRVEEEQAKAAAVIDAMIDGVTITDMQGRISDFNRAATQQLGYEKEEAIGETPGELFIVEKEHPRFFEAIEKLLSGKPIEASDYLVKRKDGTEFPVSVSLSVLRGTEGRPNAIVAVHRDITERKRIEQEIQDKNEQLDAQNEELRAANEELRATEEELRATNEELQSANDELRETQEQLIRSEKLAVIGQLASGVGHELRNPLGAIKNAAFYVRRRIAKTDLPTTEPRALEFLNLIDEEVDAANKVITDLLGFSRVAKPTVSPVSVAGVIEDTLKHTPLPENVDLVRAINENFPMVMVDGDQIRQVFVNIVLNALQAMSDGGRLEIRARSKGEFVEVDFADTGPGIPESVINKIFDPLFTTKAKGVGLGLSVCKSILERHGGDIRVESEEGRGTTFTVSLPTQ